MQNATMRVLVTGGTGFVGGWTAKAIADAGHSVRFLVRNPARLKTSVAKLGVDVSDFAVADISDRDSVREALNGCDAVVHSAALVATDPRETSRMLSTNMAGAQNVLGQAVELGMDPIVHVSSFTALFRPNLATLSADLPVAGGTDAAGVTVDRFAGTSMGAIIAALAASGLDAAGVDAQIYEHFVRKSHGDYTLPSKGLIRGKRTQSTLRTIFGDHLVEELPKHFRCVSVDLLARRPVVHRQGPLADVVGCSMRLPFLYAPLPYGGTLHVDGGVLDNVPVTTLVGKDGPLIAVNVASGGNPSPASGGHRRGKPRVPGLTDTLLRTMTISSAMASEKVLAQADLVIKPNPIGVGLMEYHQIDRAREAGRIAAREALPQIMELVHG